MRLRSSLWTAKCCRRVCRTTSSWSESAQVDSSASCPTARGVGRFDPGRRGHRAGSDPRAQYLPPQFLEPTEVPIALVRRAVKEVVLSGGRRPTCLQWREEPDWRGCRGTVWRAGSTQYSQVIIC